MISSLEIPVLQGGMGIGVSMGGLAGHVAHCGAMGTVSAANPGYREPDFWTDSLAANLRGLDAEVRKAKALAGGRGLVAVNAMVATSQYADLVKCAVAAGADAIVSGAGLPLHLPELAGEGVLLAPVVSGGKAARTICRYWDKNHSRTPDFVLLEGPHAGGHLGFSPAELAGEAVPRLEDLLPQVLEALAPFREKYGRDIPVFVAGGLWGGADLARFQALGAAGIQLATRFIGTYECDASVGYKAIVCGARAEDVTIVHSPVGMPGRALRSPLLARLEAGPLRPARCAKCLLPCDPGSTRYCITNALIEAANGNWRDGLFFCGSGVGNLGELRHVPQVMDDIQNEWRAAQ